MSPTADYLDGAEGDKESEAPCRLDGGPVQVATNQEDSSARNASAKGRFRHAAIAFGLAGLLFGPVVFAEYRWRLEPALFVAVFLGFPVFIAALIYGLFSAQGERDLRKRLTETVANLRAAQAEQARQMRRLTETHLLLEERYAETYALYLINQEIAAELDEKKILPKVVDIVLGLLGGSACSVLMVNEDKTCLRLETHSGAGRGDLVFPLAGNLLARCWAENASFSHGELTPAELDFWHARGTNGLLCAPIGTKAERVGVLLVEYDRLPASLDDHRKLLSLVAGQISLALENALLYRKVHQMATHDALTGAWNRHYFQDKLAAELAAAGPHRPLSAVILDVDDFKRINDEYGHEAGDEVLRHLTRLLWQEAPPEATVARYGGEEFVLLLTETNLQEALRLAEAVRNRVRETPCRWSGGTIGITVSLGVASYPGYASDHRSLLRLADQGLYQAKRRGKDQVALAFALSATVPAQPYARMNTM